MIGFLSDEWCKRATELLSAAGYVGGVDGVVQYVVTGAPGGKVAVHLVVSDGAVTAVAAGGHDAADCTVTVALDVAVSLLRGELNHEAAFMRGQVKVEGRYGLWLLDLDELRESAGHRAAMAELVESTSF